MGYSGVKKGHISLNHINRRKRMIKKEVIGCTNKDKLVFIKNSVSRRLKHLHVYVIFSTPFLIISLIENE